MPNILCWIDAMPDILQIAVSITTPLALIAFALALAFFGYNQYLRSFQSKLLSIPDADRVKLVDEYLTRYDMPIDDLTPDQRYRLLLKELKQRHELAIGRARNSFLLAIAILIFLVAILVIYQLNSGQANPVNSAQANPLSSAQTTPSPILISVENVERRQGITAFTGPLRNDQSEPDIGGADEVAFWTCSIEKDDASAFENDVFKESSYFIDLNVGDHSLELVGIESTITQFSGGLKYLGVASSANREGKTPNIEVAHELVSPRSPKSRTKLVDLMTGELSNFRNQALPKGPNRIMLVLARQGAGRGEIEIGLRVRRTHDGLERVIKLPEPLNVAFIDHNSENSE